MDYENEFSFRRMIWLIPDWVKRLLVGLVLAACVGGCVFLFFGIQRAEQENAAAAELRQMAAPYEEEINRIRNELRTPLAKQQSVYTSGLVLMAFLTEKQTDVPVIGTFQPLLVTQIPIQGIGTIAWNGIWKNSAALLNSSEDTETRRNQLIENGTVVLFRQNLDAMHNASGRVTREAVAYEPSYDNGVTTLPYLLIDNDNFDMAGQVNKMIKKPSCLLLLFDVSKLSSEKLLRFVTQVQVSVDAGNLKYTTISDQERLLMSASVSRKRLEAEDEEYRALQEERIRLLQEKIREIYRDWNVRHGLEN